MILLRGQIVSVEPETQRTWVSGSGDAAIFDEHRIGWRLRINNVSFVVHTETRPDFAVGQSVSLIITKD